MNIVIRNEKPEDYRRVEEVTREAFWNLYIPGCHEHYLVHTMRSHPDYIPELAFVIEVDGEIIGSIFYTHSTVRTADNREFKTVTFGPVSILPSMHRKGFGRKLITHSIKTAKQMGFRAILTLGYPYHYEPYGFVGSKKYDISMADGKYYKGLLALPLYKNALDMISGYVILSNAFDDPDEELIETYDRTFIPKKKEIQPSQKEFELACVMLDDK